MILNQLRAKAFLDLFGLKQDTPDAQDHLAGMFEESWNMGYRAALNDVRRQLRQDETNRQAEAQA